MVERRRPSPLDPQGMAEGGRRGLLYPQGVARCLEEKKSQFGDERTHIFISIVRPGHPPTFGPSKRGRTYRTKKSCFKRNYVYLQPFCNRSIYSPRVLLDPEGVGEKVVPLLPPHGSTFFRPEEAGRCLPLYPETKRKIRVFPPKENERNLTWSHRCPPRPRAGPPRRPSSPSGHAGCRKRPFF